MPLCGPNCMIPLGAFALTRFGIGDKCDAGRRRYVGLDAEMNTRLRGGKEWLF